MPVRRLLIPTLLATAFLAASLRPGWADESSASGEDEGRGPNRDLKRELASAFTAADRWLDAQRAYDRVPGLTAAIVHEEELLWTGAYGYADLEDRRPMQVDTIFGICSISKLFTGIAVMQLRDAGRFRLDTPVEDLLPWFNLQRAHPGSPSITVEGLLTHSAGLPRESDAPYWMGPDFEFPSRQEVRQLLGTQATLYPAQRYYQYSNLGLTLAGEIVTEVTGSGFADYMVERVISPLGLEDTTTGFPTDERAPRIATGYGFPGREAETTVMPRYHARGITPAAGFASTAPDLARFAAWQFRLLQGEDAGVLQANTLREMQRIQWMDQDFSVARGLGFGVYRIGDRTLIGHGGDCPGFNTRLYIDPVSRFGVVVMANRNRVDVDGYAAVLLDLLETVPTPGDDALPGAEPSAPGPALDDYVGSYDLRPWDGEELVLRWKDSLAVVTLPTMDPVGDATMLKHEAGDRFRVVRGDGSPAHVLEFLRNDEGQVDALRYHHIEVPRL